MDLAFDNVVALDLTESAIDAVSWRIGESFLKGILFEVSSYPKPGLVTPVSVGSHTDMNLITFMSSSAAIAPSFYLCAQAGRNHLSHISDLLPQLRRTGIIFEKQLLESTKNVNTQRGILFASGLMCGAAGYVSREKTKIISEDVFDAVAEMTRGLVARELHPVTEVSKDKLTAGEQLYLKYNVRGIRGEVEDGFPSVRNAGLTAFKNAMNLGVTLNLALVHTLIALMTCVDDTTILWRKGMGALDMVKEKASEVLSLGSVFTDKGMNEINKLEKVFINKNVSPGGSADLLAVTVGAYLLEYGQFPVAVM